MTEPIDLDVATATARRLMPPGPRLTRPAARAAVDQLRELAVEAERHVRDFTGLASGVEPPPAHVVDRPTWVEHNVEGFRILLGPVLARLAERRPAGPSAVVTGKVAGAQVGSILAFLGTKVLGQYEPFVDPARLTLVAPNVVEAEQALGADPRDFRMWVCLHESTHRTQFTAVPWMRGHLEQLIGTVLAAADLDPAQVRERLLSAAGTLVDAVRGGERPSLVSLVTTPEQRRALEQVTALMTLLEGHAEHVMDEVGPEVVPSVATIRERFTARRQTGTSGLDRVMRKLLALDLKLKQYVEGRRFVDAVAREVGEAGLNRVWQRPENLPTLDEIAAPAAWVARVHAA